MRLSTSDSAVSMRIGTCLAALSDLVRSTPFSPGIITSSTSRSKSRPSSRRRASAAVPATVTRKPFSVRYCFKRLRMRVSSSTTSRCGASSPGAAERSGSSLVSMPVPWLNGWQIVDLRSQFRVDHRLEEVLDDLAVGRPGLFQCTTDAARLWPGQRQRQRAALGGRVELALPAVLRALDLDDMGGV